MRTVTPEEMSSIKSEKGIIRNVPHHKTTPTQHIGGMDHSRDHWISTTRSQTSANFFATHGYTRSPNTIVKIDLSKIPSEKILDVSTVTKAYEHLLTPFAKNVASYHKEVLIFGDIPPEAIIF